MRFNSSLIIIFSILANYMGWRFVVSVINHLNKGIRRKLDIMEIDNGPHWKTCLSNLGFNNPTNGWMHGAIGSMYARRYFGTKQKHPIKTMVRYLKESFRNIIKETTWMSVDTITTALKKLDAMKEHIAYPEELLNHTIVDEYYKGEIGEIFHEYNSVGSHKIFLTI